MYDFQTTFPVSTIAAVRIDRDEVRELHTDTMREFFALRVQLERIREIRTGAVRGVWIAADKPIRIRPSAIAEAIGKCDSGARKIGREISALFMLYADQFGNRAARAFRTHVARAYREARATLDAAEAAPALVHVPKLGGEQLSLF
jgi:hypothetical protein